MRVARLARLRWIARRGGAVLCGLAMGAAAAQPAPPASAIDLLDAWRAAQRSDPQFRSDRAAHQAGETRREQAQSLWRPRVEFSGTVGRATGETATRGAQFSGPGLGTIGGANFATSIDNGNSTRWALQARQPLLSAQRDAQKRQLELSVDAAELGWQVARQALMLRTAERYFNVLLAEEALRVLRRQRTSVDSMRVEANDRFRIGDKPVTDTYEAAARAEAVRAQVLGAQMQLELAQAALSDLTGLQAEARPLAAGGDAVAPRLEPLDHWLIQARDHNPEIALRAVALDVARKEARKFEVSASPSIDLVGQLSQERLRGSGDFGPASYRAHNASIGVQLTVPLYTGGYRSAKHDEALRLVDKAEADAEHGVLEATRHTRAAWLGLTVGAARVAALSEALKASRSRLDATRLGRQVGDRTTLDLLDAESDAAGAQLALTQARVAVLLDGLRLAAQAGQLDESQLQSVNARLQPSAAR